MSLAVVASPDASYVDWLGSIIGSPLERRWSDDWAELGLTEVATLLVAGDPDVVALGPGVHHDDILGLLGTLEEQRPDLAVIVVAPITSTFLQEAFRAGARDVVDQEASEAELVEAFERAIETSHRRRVSAQTVKVPDRRIIPVLGPKGGTGKTTVATNLAAGLATEHPGRVALLDLDLQFGDAASALALDPEYDLGSAARAPHLDSTTMKVFLSRHDSGLYVLAAPDSLATADEVTPELVKNVIALLSAEFPYVVIDTAAGVDEPTIIAMEAATDLLLVASTDVPSIRALSRQLDALDTIGMTSQERHLVLNRSGAKVGLGQDEVEQTLGLPVQFNIPSNRAVPVSTNQGAPLIISNPRENAARALAEVVRVFSPPQEDEARGRRFWRKDES